MRRTVLLVAVLGITLVSATLGSQRATGAASAVSGNWTSFGRSADQTRNSPLTQITRANVDSVGRVFRLRYRDIDRTVRLGQQSYPLAIDGVLYATTNDNNVFAINGTTGKVIWRYEPPNRAVFSNFGIVANRGVASCAGRLFLATLDMHLVALDRRTGKVLNRIALADVVPGAAPNYGYSQTSAPVCVRNRVLMGAAGSEYGVRGYVMAFTPTLQPAWANPFWTIPPRQQGWRRASRIAGGGVVWTPVTADPTTNTVYFGTGSATPLYFPALRPGSNPRTNALVAVDLNTGRLKWWRQQITHNEWSYDTAQPPLVYTGRIGGQSRRVVSVATMEGVWYAYDARTGRPIYQRVKVIDRTEHPRLRPGQPVVVYPGALGGLNYSPASYDPRTNYVFNAAAETAGILIQQKLTPTEKRRKFVLGDVFLGLQNGDFGQSLPGWRDHGSISAIDVATGKRVWKIRTAEPERGGVTTTASGLGFAGGGDGVLRAFDLRNGRVLWTFQTSHPIASGPTIYSVRGKEYIAITVGGTPTSSNGGSGTELHVFSLGGSKDGDPPPPRPLRRAFAAAAAVPQTAPTVLATPKRATPRTLTASSAGTRVTGSRVIVRGWRANLSNVQVVTGRVLRGGRPVAGARVRVGPYPLRARTDSQGRYRYAVDVTVPRRHIVRVGAAKGAIDVVYGLVGVRSRVQRNGSVVVSGRVTLANGRSAPAPVVLFTYQLRGTITDAQGRPVQAAVVVTRTLDRDFWTLSTPSDAQGRYSSFFPASDRSGADPVPMNVQVAVGTTNYLVAAGKTPRFKRLRSATMDIQLPASGTTMQLSDTSSFAGAVYEGLLVGVSGRRGVIKPLAARWPDRSGRFSLTLPASARGQTITFWQNYRQFFSRIDATPGGRVDLASWPSALEARVSQALSPLRITRG
jgi:alcohol dehydrogenase (cytochrome c)